MSNGVKVLFGLFTFIATIIGVMAVARDHPEIIQHVLGTVLAVIIGLVCLTVVVALIGAILGKPWAIGLLIFLVTVGGSIAGAVYVAEEVMPRSPRSMLMAVAAVATILGVVIGGILIHAMAKDE